MSHDYPLAVDQEFTTVLIHSYSKSWEGFPANSHVVIKRVNNPENRWSTILTTFRRPRGKKLYNKTFTVYSFQNFIEQGYLVPKASLHPNEDVWIL